MRKRALALVVVALAALAVPASAAHPNIMCVDVGMNERYGSSGDDMVEYVRATIGTNDADHEEPFQEGCVPIEGDFAGTQIDFEITGAADPDSSDTPGTPDMTCTIGPGANSCYIEPPPADEGTQTFRTWIDSDGSNLTVEADRAEGHDQTTTQGDQPEPDGTDVMNWIWTPGEPRPDCGSDNVCWQRITIEYRRWRGTFFGTVSAESDACNGAKVVVWKARPGRDRKVIVTGVSGDDWRASTYEQESGRYYATISRTYAHIPNSEPPWAYECLRDRSRTIEIG
jgi:hypothetical protein